VYNKGAQIIGASPDEANKYCRVLPYILGSSVLNMLHVTFLSPRILSWLLDLLKICIALKYTCGISPAKVTINCNEAASCAAVVLTVVRHTENW
jgi:hypothetical protein